MRQLDEITGAIVDAALGIHRELGPGMLESVSQVALASELRRRGLRVQRHVPISFCFRGEVFANAFRADLIIEDEIIVELKSIEHLAPVHAKQLLTYLRLSDRRVGLLINFGAPVLKDGLKRIVNDLPATRSPALRINRPSAVLRGSASPRENGSSAAGEA